MKSYVTQEKYKISYLCWECERVTEHEFEACLIGYGDDLGLSYLSFCPSCDKYEEFNDISELEEKQGLKYYYLMDLERTIFFGEPFYWKLDKHGYTKFLGEAGKFNEIESERIVLNDHDKKTIKVSVETVDKILER